MRFYSMNKYIFKLSIASVITIAGVYSTPVDAWGRVGHAVIAARAEHGLVPQRKGELAQLLDALGVRSLADIASWADDRANPANRALARAHFVNMADDCRYVKQRDCPNGKCLVEELKRQIAILSDVHMDVLQRANALTWVVHLVGDAFQPLHAGSQQDRGGNMYQIRLGGHGTNLHAYWDSGLIYDVTHTHNENQASRECRECY